MNNQQRHAYRLATNRAQERLIYAVAHPYAKDRQEAISDAVKANKEAADLLTLDCLGCGREDEFAKPGNPWLCTFCKQDSTLTGLAAQLRDDYFDRYRD